LLTVSSLFWWTISLPRLSRQHVTDQKNPTVLASYRGLYFE
jgi:hypothetical protein